MLLMQEQCDEARAMDTRSLVQAPAVCEKARGNRRFALTRDRLYLEHTTFVEFPGRG